MEFEDCSLWHHLVFVEELVKDEENKEDKEEENDKDKDKDKDNDTDKDEEDENDEYEHDEEEKQDKEEEEKKTFWLCKEKASGPVYKCLECDFIQHQSCPVPIDANNLKRRHKLKDRHHLILVEDGNNNGEKDVACRGCEKPTSFPAYRCSIPKCPFLLHKSCAQPSHGARHPMFLDDLLFLQAPAFPNRCDGCRKRCDKRLFYRNNLCNFDMHMECLPRWRPSPSDCHEHEFNPTKNPIPFTCEACGNTGVDKAFLCSICRILTQGDCVAFEHSVRVKGHNHFLYRTYSLRQVRKHGKIFCSLCRQRVNSEYGAYYCQDCDYIIHFYCASSFESRSPDLDNPPSDFVCLVEGANATEDEIVGPQEISHFSHPDHNVMLCYERPRDDMRCEVCAQRIILSPFYSCHQSKFFPHWKCAIIPPIVKRELFHEHPLTLLSDQSHDESSFRGLFQCKLCHRERHGFIYECDECENFQLDVQCCLIPERLEHRLHEHPLFLAFYGPFKCDGCSFFISVPQVFKCTDCRFQLCFRCVTLPVARHRYDRHLLGPTIGCDDDSNDNYCLICEKERDPKCMFYYCKECDFTAHSYCVIGKNPSVKFERPYLEKFHKHPFTFVNTTEDSPPCDVCGESFAIDGNSPLDYSYSLAVECSKCKLILHFRCQPGLRDHKVS